MTEPVVFFSRCKPQGADALPVALDAGRIFIGHPMQRVGADYQPHNLKACVVDPSCSDEEWEAARAQQLAIRPQYNQNRNLVKGISLGSIAMIPRPDRGVIYCGKIVSGFELVDNPPWYKQYMQGRRDQGHAEEDGPDTWHAADVSQSWKVDHFRPIPVPRIPAWIRRSLFGRSTYGVVKSQEGIDTNPHATLLAILESQTFDRRHWSLDPATVERRLMEDLTPATFEHLVVSLLQLEHPDETWAQVGGSGDGGIDGVGADDTGHVTGLLQCKWQYWGGDPFFSHVWQTGSASFRTYLASLLCPENIARPANTTFLARSDISKLVIKHHDRLPQAIGMRIGTG